MSSVVGSPIPSRIIPPQISLFRLYTLRVAYLILAVGIGVFYWPIVIHHTSDLALSRGIQLAILAGLGLTAVLGLRYPVQMLPLLLFEIIWKTIYLVAFALPLWSAHQITPAAAQDITAVLWVVIFIPLVPWRYVLSHYVMQHGERWK